MPKVPANGAGMLTSNNANDGVVAPDATERGHERMSSVKLGSENGLPMLTVPPFRRISEPVGGELQVTTLEGPILRSTPDFNESADGATLLYSRLEVSTSQARMVEEQK